MMLNLKPGDMVIAQHRMLGWKNDWERRGSGIWIEKDTVALIISMFQPIGSKRWRLKVLFNDRLATFSCREQHINNNWLVTAATSA